MKKLFNMLVVGMISFLGFSQEPNNSTTMVELDDVTLSNVNATYLATIQDKNVPAAVVLLQQEAANFDVRSSKNFSEEVTTDVFEIVFRNSKGYLNAFYDNTGKIESAYERFKNIALPKTLQHQLYRVHQGWTMTGNLYSSAYEDEILIDRSFKILLKKGNVKKNVVFHLSQ